MRHEGGRRAAWVPCVSRPSAPVTNVCNRIYSEFQCGRREGGPARRARPPAGRNLTRLAWRSVLRPGKALRTRCSRHQPWLWAAALASRALRTSRAPARPAAHAPCAPRAQEATRSSDSPSQGRGQSSPARSESPTELSQAPSVTELSQAPSVTELSQVPAGGDEAQASPRTRVKGRAAHSPSTAQTPPHNQPAVQRPAGQPPAALDLAEEALLQALVGRS